MIKVFYSTNTRDTAMIGMVHHSKNDSFKAMIEASVRNAANYDHVVTFDDSARDHEDIWEALQAEVSGVPRKLHMRSMMVGDIIVNDTNEVFVVMSCGFERLEGANVEALLARVREVPSLSVRGELEAAKEYV